MVFKTNNKTKVHFAAIRNLVMLLCFLFFCGFSNTLVAENNFGGLYIKGEVKVTGTQFIYHKQSEKKIANKTTIYIAENTLVSGLHTTNTIAIVFLKKKNKLETLVSNDVPKKFTRNKTKLKSTTKNQISAMPYGNLPFESKNTNDFCTTIYFSSNYKKKQSIHGKTSVKNVLIYDYADALLQKEKLNYSFLKAKLYNLHLENQYITRPPPVV